jgi:hypothetical protein
MSICKYCNHNAGWFKDAHASCVQKANEAVKAIKVCMADAVTTGKKYSDVAASIDKLRADAGLSKTQADASLINSWSQAVEQRAKAQASSAAETEAVFQLALESGFKLEDAMHTAGGRANNYSYLTWLVLHKRFESIEATEPWKGSFNLQAGETPVWGMPHMLIRQQSTQVSYSGGYNGISVRIASGLWYRFGGGRGHKEEHTELQDIDIGDFLLTNRAVYFGGKQRGVNFRLPYNQIMRFQYYSDSVGICKSGGREQIFVSVNTAVPADNGWFLFNMLQALSAQGT